MYITAQRHEKCPIRSTPQVTIFSKQILYKLTSGSKLLYSVLDKLILYSFLIFLNKVLEFLNFLNDLVLVSYKPVSYKKACILT